MAMLTFIALIIHTDTIKVNRLNNYWKKHHFFNFTCFSVYMAFDRFLNVLRCFHYAPNIDDNQDQQQDRLYRIRPLITYFNNKMNNICYPKKKLSLDESMVLWRGLHKCYFILLMKSILTQNFYYMIIVCLF